MRSTGLPILVQLAPRFENRRALHVAEIIVADNLDGAVVAPFVRIADLVDHAVQLLDGALLGVLAHPWQLLDLILHGHFDFLGHHQRSLLGFRRERLGHEYLSQSFAQIAIHLPDAAFPARRHLLQPAQIFAEEIEVGVHKRRRKICGFGVYQMPAKVSLPIVQAVRLEQDLQLFVERGLADVDDGEVAQPARP